jgi:dsRNA-specific ribonuclease
MNNLEDVLETKSYKDSKSELQEIVQDKLKVTPTYSVLGEDRARRTAGYSRWASISAIKLIAAGTGAVEAGGGARGSEERAQKISLKYDRIHLSVNSRVSFPETARIERF